MPHRTRIIPRRSLDTARWNAHLDASAQGRIYGHSQYLDVVAPGWRALVLEDSSGQWLAAMPLNLKQKGGFVPYVYPAPFCQQWGPYLAPGVGTEVLHPLLRDLPFSVDTVLKLAPDFAPEMAKLGPGWEVKPRTNQVLRRPKELPIVTSYLTDYDTGIKEFPKETAFNLYSKMSHGRKSDLKLAEKFRLRFYRTMVSDTTIYLPAIHPKKKMDEPWASDELERITNSPETRDLINKLFEKIAKQGRIVEFLTKPWFDSPIHTYGYYLIDRNRYYSLALVRNPEVNKSPGVTLMHYHTILMAWATGRDFDFEGSDIAGVQAFNASFGAEVETYWEIRRQNRLLRLRKA